MGFAIRKLIYIYSKKETFSTDIHDSQVMGPTDFDDPLTF